MIDIAEMLHVADGNQQQGRAVGHKGRAVSHKDGAKRQKNARAKPAATGLLYSGPAYSDMLCAVSEGTLSYAQPCIHFLFCIYSNVHACNTLLHCCRLQCNAERL